jgi:hypothetical protein
MPFLTGSAIVNMWAVQWIKRKGVLSRVQDSKIRTRLSVMRYVHFLSVLHILSSYLIVVTGMCKNVAHDGSGHSVGFVTGLLQI